MHTVCELHSFRHAAMNVGLTENDVENLITYLANNPAAGKEMGGTGGCRKLRWAGRGKGKSGGYRCVTFFTGNEMPVFLLTVFSKGQRSDLSKDETNQLAKITTALVAEYRKRIVRVKGASCARLRSRRLRRALPRPSRLLAGRPTRRGCLFQRKSTFVRSGVGRACHRIGLRLRSGLRSIRCGSGSRDDAVRSGRCARTLWLSRVITRSFSSYWRTLSAVREAA